MTLFILSVALSGLLVPSAVFGQPPSPFVGARCDPAAPTFSNVHLPQAVLADGKPLAAGDYQVRITTEHPAPAAGQSPTAECWIEFIKGGTIAGREVASVVSAEEIGAVAKGPQPGTNAVRVDLLKGGKYLRVWMNGAGTHYVINMPVVR